MDPSVLDRLKAATTLALVKKYTEIRERLKVMENDAKLAADPLQRINEAIENVLLARMNADGSDNIGTDAGIVYRFTHKSVSVTDPEAFWRYAVDNDAPELYQNRANVSEVEARIQTTGEAVPGATLRSYQTARIRKA